MEAAHEKFIKADLSALMWVGDMKNIAVRRSVGGVVSCYDRMNYLLSESDWLLTLANVSAMLPKRGLFIFDICTEYNSIHNFSNYKDQDGGPGFYFTRRSTYYKKEKLQKNFAKIYSTEKVTAKQVVDKIFQISEG